jgi:predicted aspartyl protease
MSQPFTSSRFPYLPIRIQIGRQEDIQQELDLEPLVDTGFDGGVAVPSDLIDSLVTPDGHLPWYLADGTELLTPAYLASVQIAGLQPVPTVVIALGDESLLGRDVTNHFRLVFDHGHAVIVEP